MSQIEDCPYENKNRFVDDTKSRRQLIIACILCTIFAVGEIIGGVISNSLAILTDSVHLFSDLSSFIISLIALYLARRKPSDVMTFGWHRAEILGALISILIIWLVTGILVYEAVNRLISTQYNIDALIMLIMSILGVVVNIILAFVLNPHSHSHGGLSNPHGHSHGHSHHKGPHHGHSHHKGSHHDCSPEADNEPLLPTSESGCGAAILITDHRSPHSSAAVSSHLSSSSNSSRLSHAIAKSTADPHKHENINIRAAFIHVIGDILQSIGTMIAAIVIYIKPEYKAADPICTFIFSALVMITTIQIIRDISAVLVESRPQHIPSSLAVCIRLQTIPGVLEVHNLRLWSISMSYTAGMLHMVVDKTATSHVVLQTAHHILQTEFKLSETTIQIEPTDNDQFNRYNSKNILSNASHLSLANSPKYRSRRSNSIEYKSSISIQPNDTSKQEFFP